MIKTVTDETINEAISEMRNLSNFLVEGLYTEDDVPFDKNIGSNNQEMLGDGNVQESTPNVDITPIISQIRKLALDGISKFASFTESNEYQFFKKIFLECDKAISNNNKPKSTES